MGMYPSTGYARGQEKGLSTLSNKPVNGALMPLGSSFYAGSNNRLGQPKV